MTETGKNFIANVKSMLERYGWDQKDLAGQMGVSPAYISQVLSGQYNVSLAVVEQFAEALECPVQKLLRDRS